MPRCCSTLVTLHGSFLQNLVVCLITRLVQIYIFILIWNSLLKSPKNIEQELFFLILQVQQQKSKLQQFFFHNIFVEFIGFSALKAGDAVPNEKKGEDVVERKIVANAPQVIMVVGREEGGGHSGEEDSSKRPSGHNGGG